MGIHNRAPVLPSPPRPNRRHNRAVALGAVAGALASMLIAAVAPATLTPVRSVVESVTGQDRIVTVTPCAARGPAFADRPIEAEWKWSPRGVDVASMYRTP